jgi:hypothetical protein
MRVTLVRALLAACVAVLGMAQAAAAASPDKLLAKYQPVTVFSQLESFRPTSIETFVVDSRLEALTGPNLLTDWTVVNPAPQASSLPTSSPTVLRLNQRGCSPAFGLVGLSCYASSWGAHAAASVVYGRAVMLGQRTVLQYWYFYYDNFYSYQDPPSNFIWQAHEGDWEVVNVVLGGDGEPRSVGYSQHCLGERRIWSKTPRWHGHHPIVYVARGSHANYFAPGLHAFDARCVPAAALTILQQLALPLPVDYASTGALAGPAALEQEATSIVRVEDGSPSWISFPGFWGELQYFKAPVPLPGSPSGIVPLGTSPVGPAFHAVWQDPLATLATWPAG